MSLQYHIYTFAYASFDMSSLCASFVGCILNVQNAYDKGENVCAITKQKAVMKSVKSARFIHVLTWLINFGVICIGVQSDTLMRILYH